MNASLVGLAVSCCAVGMIASQAFAAEPGPLDRAILPLQEPARPLSKVCLLYTSDAADE